MNELRPFFIRLSLLTLILAVIYFVSPAFRPQLLTHETFPVMLLMFFGLTAAFHYGLVRSGNKGNSAFVRYYMGATTLKLFFYMGVIIVYALFGGDNIRGFIMLFFILYLLYTSFEVSYVYRKLSGMKSVSDKAPDSENK